MELTFENFYEGSTAALYGHVRAKKVARCYMKYL